MEGYINCYENIYGDNGHKFLDYCGNDFLKICDPFKIMLKKEELK